MPTSPDGSPVAPVTPATDCVLSVREFDFRTKTSSMIDLAAVAAARGEGRYVWIDLEFASSDAGRQLVTSLELVSEQVIEDMFADDPGTQLSRYPNYLHLVLASCRFGEEGSLSLGRVDVAVGQDFLLTVHQGARPFLQTVARECYDDFLRFAQSPSFLIYEIWDHLIEHYVRVEKRLEQRVARLQTDLFKETDDAVFAQVLSIGSDLLHFRSVLMPARSVLTDLGTRRSVFVSEATQVFLLNMVGTVERVLQDVLVDRDILAQALNLYMSRVGQRTNRAMNRLTVISVVFLPLTFLCGVYGMNFQHIPELSFRYGYQAFWGVSIAIVLTLIAIMRRARLL